MHEYEMKYFSKTQVLNSVFPKLDFQPIFLKILKHKICFAETKNNFKLGWSDQKIHTITYTMFSKE